MESIGVVRVNTGGRRSQTLKVAGCVGPAGSGIQRFQHRQMGCYVPGHNGRVDRSETEGKLTFCVVVARDCVGG